MKKRLSIILIGALVMVFALAGCGNGGSADKTDKKDSSNKKISVVTTIFPEYDVLEKNLMIWNCFIRGYGKR